MTRPAQHTFNTVRSKNSVPHAKTEDELLKIYLMLSITKPYILKIYQISGLARSDSTL